MKLSSRRLGTTTHSCHANASTDGEQDLDAHVLARLDVCVHACAAVARQVVEVGQVRCRRLTLAKCGEEGHVDELVVSSGVVNASIPSLMFCLQ